MKIGYFADGPWSHRALEYIFSSSDLEIVFIVPRYDTRDPVLNEWAEKLCVPFILVDNVNSPEFLSSIKEYSPDLLVSMSFNQILKKEIIDLSPNGFINCHAGALPFYRGRNPLNWVLINGEKSFGITVHYVDEGIDTGDIIEQKIYPISMIDNYQSLLNLAVVECAEVLITAIKKIKAGSVKKTSQQDIHPVGTYFGVRKFGDENIDFSWGAEKFYNFVRAISYPGPGARFNIDGQEYAIEGCELIPHAPTYIATEGEVVGRTAGGVVVKLGDATVLLTAIRVISLDSNSEPFQPKFKIGTRLSNGG